MMRFDRLRTEFLCWCLVAMAFALSACSTMADIVQHKGDGTAQVYDVSLDQAWEIAKVVFRTEGTDAIEEHRDHGYMLTSSGMNMYSYGTVMGAWVEPSAGGKTQVTVLTKRRIATEVFTTLTESTFHKRFAQGVGVVKSGSPLPPILPN